MDIDETLRLYRQDVTDSQNRVEQRQRELQEVLASKRATPATNSAAHRDLDTQIAAIQQQIATAQGQLARDIATVDAARAEARRIRGY